MATQLFVDTSKRRGFTLAVVELRSVDVSAHRKAMRQQLLRGQERIHFTGESKARRKVIWQEVATWRPAITIHIIESSRKLMAEARAESMAELTRIAPELGARLVVIERDSSREVSDRKAPSDRQVLTDGLRGTGISWDIREAAHEPLLWVADGAAWLWSHPEHAWRKLVKPMIGTVIRI